MGPRSGPGSEGSKGSKGSEDGGIAIGHACGVKVDGPKGPKVLKVLRFDSGFAAEGGGIAQGAMSIYAAYRRQKPLQPRLRRDGNAPLSPPMAVLLLKGSMSLDSQSPTAPYESSSFATPEGEVCSMFSVQFHELHIG